MPYQDNRTINEQGLLTGQKVMNKRPPAPIKINFNAANKPPADYAIVDKQREEDIEYRERLYELQKKNSGGGGGKIICTELDRQGLLDKEIFKHDAKYGDELKIVRPDLVIWYQNWATPIVNLMQRSKLFSYFVAVIARPIARHIAYLGGYEKDSFIGKILYDLAIKIFEMTR